MPCSSSTCWSNHNYCHIWFMDIPNRLWYFCACCQLHQQKMEAMSYYSGFFWGSWNNGGCNSYAIKISLLAWHELLNKVITYVKDEGANLSTLTMALTNIVSCVPPMLSQPYATISYGHAMSKCCQYATNGTREVSIKAT